MLELHLGTVDVDDNERTARFEDVIGEPSISPPTGRLELIGRFDAAARRFASGALVKNIGNDQWSVHLLTTQQLARLAESELVKARHEIADSGHSLGYLVAAPLAPEIAAHLVGLGSVALTGEAVDVAASALHKTFSGPEAEAQRIGETLARSGVDPASKGVVRAAVMRHLTGSDHGLELGR
jgi:hypothetical protein